MPLSTAFGNMSLILNFNFVKAPTQANKFIDFTGKKNSNRILTCSIPERLLVNSVFHLTCTFLLYFLQTTMPYSLLSGVVQITVTES